jgi:hypothetical protein
VSLSCAYRPGFDPDQYTIGRPSYVGDVWQPISSAPFDRDLELAVIDRDGPHALVFACRRVPSGWINAESKQRIDVRPTHWRDWGVKD